jgi:predicted dinucleotide-binding enzyme
LRRRPAVLFYGADHATAAVEVETLIKTAGFDPVRAGGVAASGRIESAATCTPRVA